jgi:hypothetical protein
MKKTKEKEKSIVKLKEDPVNMSLIIKRDKDSKITVKSEKLIILSNQ